MKYIGNFSNWIKTEWVEYLLNNNGTMRPNTAGENPDSEEFRIATSVGYDLSKTWWQHYCKTSCPLQITPPIDTDKEYMWWFIKMIPGNYMPMHRDPHVTEKGKENCTRYWMPLQDYQQGHIFIYNNTFIKDYKAGDLWCYTDANEIHGACNIGYTTRLTFQFTTYDTDSRSNI
jgi:hypothetical protein